MTDELLVIDNSVLSAFDAAGWLYALENYSPDRTVAVTEYVWENEFRPEHGDRDDPLDFLTVISTQAIAKVRSRPGALSAPDWTCVELAREHGGSILVANDRTLLETAEEHGVDTMWGTQLARHLFRDCAISQSEFDEGIDDYIDDVFLPDNVAVALRDTEKSVETIR